MTTLAFWHGWGILPEVFTPFITELKKLLPENVRCHCPVMAERLCQTETLAKSGPTR